MTNLVVNHPMSDGERRDAVFDGNLLVQASDDTTRALAAHAKSLITQAFGDLDPERGHFSLAVEDFVARIGPLKTRFTNDSHTKELVRTMFDELNEEAFPGETIAVMDTVSLNDLRVRRFDFEPRISYAIMGD